MEYSEKFNTVKLTNHYSEDVYHIFKDIFRNHKNLYFGVGLSCLDD